MSEASRGGVQSVARAFDLVEVIAARGGTASLSELATVTGLPAATAHRLLRTLITCGYLVQLQDRRYGLSQKLVPIGAAAARRTGR
ncbi:helix-turn-helix domain-containing protein [Nesterenkonia muleiensis]|uniref:helix-turn-helix domain-containing protein n=1 Tax=Nesterenkonia muleiensis TaxID=2282648 RepID=UPI000E757774|nr:helix-turn-helix domain-containing protein [Nesterenkonia muleiensis]